MKNYVLDKSKSTYENLKKILAGGRHHNFSIDDNEIPIKFVKGNGSRLWDADGNEFLDLYCKFGAMFLGHDNQQYREKLKQAIDELPIVDYTCYDLDVCKLFQKYIPCCERIRFGLSGTEMVQNAIRLARAYTKKNRILTFEGHYHGSADNIMGGKVDNILCPYVQDDDTGVFATSGRAKGILESQTIRIPWNNVEILEKTLKTYGADIAAIITEPVNLNGGSIMPQKGYLEAMRELCDKNNIILIFDEIITGIRLGLGGAQKLYNVIPDLCLMGKAITGGEVPVSALLGKKEIMSLYENNTVVHGGTYNGYGLGMAAISATFDILTTDTDEKYSDMKNFHSEIKEIFLKETQKEGIDIIIQGPATCSSYHCSDSEITNYYQLTDTIIKKNNILRKCMMNYGILTCHTSRMYTNISLNHDDVSFFEERISYALKDAKIMFNRLFK